MHVGCVCAGWLRVCATLERVSLVFFAVVILHGRHSNVTPCLLLLRGYTSTQ